VLRAVSTTSMSVINNVLRAAAEGGEPELYLESQIDFDIPVVPVIVSYGAPAGTLNVTVEPDGGKVFSAHYAKADFPTELALALDLRKPRLIAVSGDDATTLADVLAVTQTFAKVRWRLVAP